MKVSLVIIHAAILFSSATFVIPVGRGLRTLHARQRGGNATVNMGPASRGSVGAAYFITNEPNGNFIVSADISQDGKLTLRQAISAGGSGLHGNDGGANGPDPLFTQGAVKVSAAANILATVNPGSNTISVFNIDQNDPATIAPIGDPIGSGGEFPVSVAFNKAGDMLCALNGGEVNSVSCFKVDKNDGLVPAAGTNRRLDLNQTTPANGPAGTVSHVLFSEDNKQLVTSVKGVPPNPGFLAVWDVNQDGSLSKNFRSIAPSKGGLLPFSMTLIPGKNAILATDAGVGFDIFDFSASENKSTSVAAGKSSVVAIDGQKATCWSSFSPKTGNFYLTDVGTSQVTEVKVDENLKGAVVKQYDLGQNSGTIDNDIVSIGGKDFMFVLSANATRVDVLSLDAPGQAKNIQKLDIAGPAKAAGLKINGSNLQGMTTFIKK
ncbi:hypothetical protein E1B28_004227 [Marasmius oreades]|uniref:3-carboxymuconate cyclase n=1 Tax=Marasmius oreades TaxID=181124 RepID=A0A9P7UY77_9AGAR|nr:uncharacterized protein E1B28_004227 [Marasmius oreades]KAG7096818.1 hypothetical protein E1B28_004227 [Marasmius oreades]